jgi:CO/xanthine dehydrogenase Mo-binding subunit
MYAAALRKASALRSTSSITTMPSPFTEYGIKGGGEGGRMGAPPALCSAIEDALRPLSVKIDAMPVTPRRLRTLIRGAQTRAA